MKKGSIKYILIIAIILLNSCDLFEKYKLEKGNIIVEGQKQNFVKDYKIKNIYSHFPDELYRNTIDFIISGPTCPPSYDCSAQFGDMWLIIKKSDYIKELPNLLKNNFVDELSYDSSSNIILNLPELKYDRFPIEKCNKYVENSFPIPYFEAYDFGLGVSKTVKVIDDITYTDYTNTVPSNLKVYVIEAKAGDFWIENCNEKRPEALKEWKHGYSRGIATSEEENIIVFWAMIW